MSSTSLPPTTIPATSTAACTGTSTGTSTTTTSSTRVASAAKKAKHKGPSQAPGNPFTDPSGKIWPSKSGYKKSLKMDKMRANHADRKQKEKDKKKEARAEYLRSELAKGRDVLKEEEERLANRDMDALKLRAEATLQRRQASADNAFGICIDCSFESQMSTKELSSLSRQIAHAYSFNKRAHEPIHLCVTDLKRDGDCRAVLAKQGGYPDEWKFFAEKALSEGGSVPDFAIDDLVYLTADSPNTIATLDSSKTYVIGGIVDRNRLQKATLHRAAALGIATARLPIGEIMKMQATKVLTVNHVAEILARFKTTNSWETAMVETLPQRKGGELRDGPADDDDEEEEDDDDEALREAPS